MGRQETGARGTANARDSRSTYREFLRDDAARKRHETEDLAVAHVTDPCYCNAPVPAHNRDDHDEYISALLENGKEGE